MLAFAFANHDVIWAVSGNKDVVGDKADHRLTDANKETPLKLIQLGCEVIKVLARERPEIIVSTGAAPGLLAILFGRLMGAKTLWIDSVANSARLSLSGRIARLIANATLTQWKHLVTGGVEYWGAVI